MHSLYLDKTRYTVPIVCAVGGSGLILSVLLFGRSQTFLNSKKLLDSHFTFQRVFGI